MSNRIGHRVEWHDTIASTNTRAAECAADADGHGVVVMAERQTAGRGQHGRVWQCPPESGVLMSVLLLPPPSLRRPVVLTAWAAVAVAETVAEVAGVQATIKWPNDVLMDGRKVCGILIEGGAGVVAGIGLNVNQTAEDFAAMGLPDAASLRTITGCSFDRDDVARRLIAHLDAEYARLERGDLATLEACWRWRMGLAGRTVVAELADGSRFTGELRELGFDAVAVGRHEWVPESIRQLRPVG